MPVLWLDFGGGRGDVAGRLVWRTAWFLVGAVLFVPVSQAFPPLELDKILIFVGGSVFSGPGAGLLDGGARAKTPGDRSHQEGLLRFSAGPVDSDDPAVHQRQIRYRAAASRDDFGGGEIRHAGLSRTQRLVVTSWREDRPVERVPVERDDYMRFHVGDAVVVEIQNGVVGIPWVYAVHRP